MTRSEDVQRSDLHTWLNVAVLALISVSKLSTWLGLVSGPAGTIRALLICIFIVHSSAAHEEAKLTADLNTSWLAHYTWTGLICWGRAPGPSGRDAETECGLLVKIRRHTQGDGDRWRKETNRETGTGGERQRERERGGQRQAAETLHSSVKLLHDI